MPIDGSANTFNVIHSANIKMDGRIIISIFNIIYLKKKNRNSIEKLQRSEKKNKFCHSNFRPLSANNFQIFIRKEGEC